MTNRLLIWWGVFLIVLSGEYLLLAPEAGAKDSVKRQVPAITSSGLRKAAGGNPGVVEIISDPLGETEFRVADEIASAVASTQETGPNGEIALRVIPVVSRGGIQAVRDVLTLPNADFGIVSAQILDRLQKTRELGDIKNRIAYVAPLYVEEIHLLAGPNVRSLADLQGQAVSIGEDEGTTQVIARELLSSADIQVRAERWGLKESIAALKAGKIAAAFVVSGKPVDDLKTLATSDGLRLVPITLSSPPSGFLPSTITAEDYPALLRPGEKVNTFGVQNILFAYNWPSQSQRAQLEEMFVKSLVLRLAALKRPPHHPKWQEVEPARTLPGWQRLVSMDTWLKQLEKRLRAEFDQFITETNPNLNTADRELLFQNYLRRTETPSTTGSR